MKNRIITTKPPELQNPYGTIMGIFAAGISIFFAILQLFRIDTLVPLVDVYVPGGVVGASLLIVAVLLAQVFGVPFALRMKLSRLGHVVSGALLAMAPLYWLLVNIWNYGLDHVSTGQFGSFVSTPSGWVAMLLNAAWLVFVLATLWALGYGSYRLPDRRRGKKA